MFNVAPTLGDLPDPAAWGLPDLAFEPMPGGHRNRVLRGIGVGAGFVFKTTTRTPQALAWLAAVKRPALEAGFVVALPQPTRSGAVAAAGWTMEPWIEGAPLDAGDLPRLGTAMADLHRRTQGIAQRPGFAAARDLLQQTRGGDIDLGQMPEPLVAMCRAAWTVLPDDPLTLVHGDLNPGNILLTPSGHFALLDWDEARADLPLFDRMALGETGDTVARTAALAYEIACCWGTEPARAHRLARDLSNALGPA